MLRGEIGHDSVAHGVGRHIDPQHADHRKRRSGIDAVPMRLALIFSGRKAGLFLEFARDAARNIERAVPDVVEVGRSGGKIDAPRVRRMLAHLAEHKRAVGAKKRAHAKTVEHGRIGKTPVAPGQKTCKISFEIAGAQAVTCKHRVAPEQDAAVKQRRPFALLVGKMRIDLGAARFGKRPHPRFDNEVEHTDAMNDQRFSVTHRLTSPDFTPILPSSYFVLVPVVFLACSTYLLVQVLVTSILAFATSGEPSLNTASTASAPLGSIMPVSEYIGIVFFSAAR